MKLLISELARMTGVSVRTLHYYDEIGLLHADYVDEQNGYRYYMDNSILKMQQILFYRELDFPLKDIERILSSEKYNKKDALNDQKNLLIIKKQRLEKLIGMIESSLEGENTMSFESFDNTKYTEYLKEAKERWGNTDQYKEFKEKSSSKTKKDYDSAAEQMDGLLKQFADCFSAGIDCTSEKPQSLVSDWQNVITENYYNCTKEMLANLALMYTQDERFTKNMDKYKAGTTVYIKNCIDAYCR